MRKTLAPDYEIGRCRPPVHTRWTNGQCGNPKRIRRRRMLDVAALIDRAFARKVKIREGGGHRVASVFEVIILQLWAKSAQGNTRALRILLRYHNFAARTGGFGGVEIRFGSEK